MVVRSRWAGCSWSSRTKAAPILSTASIRTGTHGGRGGERRAEAAAALDGMGGIQKEIRAAGFEHAQQRHDGPFGLVKHQRPKRLGANTHALELCGEGRREAIQLLVAEVAVPRRHGTGFWLCRSLLGDQVVYALRVRILVVGGGGGEEACVAVPSSETVHVGIAAYIQCCHHGVGVQDDLLHGFGRCCGDHVGQVG